MREPAHSAQEHAHSAVEPAHSAPEHAHSAVLIVFVDALPFDDLMLARALSQWPYRRRLKPGFGYSINLHAELFAGLTPDEAGFFGEWGPDPARAPGARYARLLPLLDAVFRPYVLNRGLQTVLTARYRRDRIMPNIPLARLGDFAILGEKITDPGFERPTLFSRFPALETADSSGRRKGERDRAILADALERILSGVRTLYVPLPDLDGIGHTHRRSSAEWQAHVAYVGDAVEDLARAFLERNPGGDVFVVSDHGMADVRAGVRYTPRAAGPQGADKYLLFTDSTLLRAWVARPELEGLVRAEIEGTDGLNLISQRERAAYGLESRAFGTFIAVLDEGLCFEPSTFARHIPAAMHGYHPDVSSQHAVLLHRGAHAPPAAERTLDVYAILEAAVQRSI